MKRIMLLAPMIAASLTLLAIHATECLAAAVETPSFSRPAKLFEGSAIAPGGKILTTDGSSFYTAFVVDSAESQTSSLRVVRISKDNTVSGASEPLFSRSSGVINNHLSIAAGIDSRKVHEIHLIWSQTANDADSGTGPGIYYAWSDDTQLRKWSTPARVNHDIDDFDAISLVIGKSGAINVVFRGNGDKIFHATASSSKAPFTQPVQIADGMEKSDRNVDITLDRDDNLHLAFAAVDDSGKVGVRYMKKLAAASKWSKPGVVLPLTPASSTGFIAIAAADPKTVYIASTLVNEKTLEVLRSNDGGVSWTGTKLIDKPSRHVSIAVASNSSVTVAVGVLTDDAATENIAVFRSPDGQTWSTPAIIPKVSSANIVSNSSAKAGLLSEGASETGENASYFAKEL